MVREPFLDLIHGMVTGEPCFDSGSGCVHESEPPLCHVIVHAQLGNLGFFFYSPRPPNQKPALIFLTMLVVTVNALFMAILLYSMCSQVLKEKKVSVIK
jgi:hypothetical protein